MSDYTGPVSVNENDHADLVALLNSVFRDEGGDMFSDYPRHLSLNNRDNIRVIKVNGKILAHVGTTIRPVTLGGVQIRVAGIGAVATHPDGRGKGYATLLMNDAIERSEAQGADVMLISGDNGVYFRIGARVCGAFPTVTVHKDRLTTPCAMQVEPATQQDLPIITRLRERQATRYLLPKEDIEALFNGARVMDKPNPAWWIVRQGGNTVAFGVTHIENGTVELLDWAGSPDALPYAAVFWLDHYRADKLTYTAADTTPLPLSWHSFLTDARPFYGTVLVLNAERFLNTFKPLIEERMGEGIWNDLKIEADKTTVTFLYKDDSATFELPALSELFFGVIGRDVIAENVNADSKLYKTLSAIFPLPLVWYGLGYV